LNKGKDGDDEMNGSENSDDEMNGGENGDGIEAKMM
jgi:hypothetical protein